MADYLGMHLIIEYRRCKNNACLTGVAEVEKMMLLAAEKARATVVSHDFHQFSPHGVSGAVILAESHISIHTWPEYEYAAVDIFTCGNNARPHRAAKFLKKALNSKKCQITPLERGAPFCKFQFKIKSTSKLFEQPVHV